VNKHRQQVQTNTETRHTMAWSDWVTIAWILAVILGFLRQVLVAYALP
jgi:hypothetical protein